MVRRLAIRILTPQAIKNGVSLVSLNNSTCCLPLEKVFRSFSTKSFMDKMLREEDITRTQYNKSLQAFYKESLEYVLTKTDMSESLWSHVCCVDFYNREKSSWSEVEYFVSSFSSILQVDKQEMNLLCKQFVDLQTLSEEERPNGALADAIIKEFEEEDGKIQSEY